MTGWRSILLVGLVIAGGIKVPQIARSDTRSEDAGPQPLAPGVTLRDRGKTIETNAATVSYRLQLYPKSTRDCPQGTIQLTFQDGQLTIVQSLGAGYPKYGKMAGLDFFYNLGGDACSLGVYFGTGVIEESSIGTWAIHRKGKDVDAK
jgi:hypothetical protein